MRRPQRVLVVLVFSAFTAALALPQQSVPPPPPSAPPSASSSSSSHPSKHSHANDFLLTGTVFDPQGYAFPGVQLRVRRDSEKKYRWDSYTNSRGDFAVRIPRGAAYEMLVHAKGFADQTRAVDAKSGLSETRIVFRMESAKDQKK